MVGFFKWIDIGCFIVIQAWNIKLYFKDKYLLVYIKSSSYKYQQINHSAQSRHAKSFPVRLYI